MTRPRLLRCDDADGKLVGYIVCEDDRAYEEATKQIGLMDLEDQRSSDLPSLEQLRTAKEAT